MAAREAGRAEVWNTSVAAQSPSRTCWEMRRNWLQLSEPQWRARQPSLQNAGEGFQGESSRFRFLPSFSLKYGAQCPRMLGRVNTVTAIHVSKAGWILYAVATDSMMNRKGIVTARSGEGLQLTDKLCSKSAPARK